jgi:hypothetical protein
MKISIFMGLYITARLGYKLFTNKPFFICIFVYLCIKQKQKLWTILKTAKTTKD